MKQNQNIEDLFKDAFENFEADVSPDVWANVQSQISTGASAGSSASGSSGMGAAGIGKLVAGIAVVGAVGFGVVTLINKDKKAEQLTQDKVEQVLVEMSTEDLTPQDAAKMDIESLDIDDADDVILNPEEQIAEIKEDKAVAENNSKPFNYNINKPNNADPIAQKVPVDPDVQGEPDNGSFTKEDARDLKKVLEQNPSPAVVTSNKILADKIEGAVPLRVKFGTENPAVSYKWTFDNAVSEEANPEHEFTNAGEHVVTLEWTNEEGTMQTVTRTIKVSAKASMIVPNVISPNGDLTNDVLTIKTVNIESIQGMIMDPKTKQIIYQWSDVEYAWDATDMSGNNVQAGTYLIIVKGFPMAGGKPEVHKGTVQVFR